MNTFTPSGTPTKIWVTNHATTVKDEDVDVALPRLQAQANQDFARAWEKALGAGARWVEELSRAPTEPRGCGCVVCADLRRRVGRDPGRERQAHRGQRLRLSRPLSAGRTAAAFVGRAGTAAQPRAVHHRPREDRTRRGHGMDGHVVPRAAGGARRSHRCGDESCRGYDLRTGGVRPGRAAVSTRWMAHASATLSRRSGTALAPTSR